MILSIHYLNFAYHQSDKNDLIDNLGVQSDENTDKNVIDLIRRNSLIFLNLVLTKQIDLQIRKTLSPLDMTHKKPFVN